MKTAEVAERLEISAKTVRVRAEQGFIPCRIIPGKKNLYLFDRRTIEEYIRGEYAEQESYDIDLSS